MKTLISAALAGMASIGRRLTQINADKEEQQEDGIDRLQEQGVGGGPLEGVHRHASIVGDLAHLGVIATIGQSAAGPAHSKEGPPR